MPAPLLPPEAYERTDLGKAQGSTIWCRSATIPALLIVARSGIGGFSVLGDFVVLGASAGIADNVTVGEGAQIAAGSGVRQDVPAGAHWSGTPARPLRRADGMSAETEE